MGVRMTKARPMRKAKAFWRGGSICQMLKFKLMFHPTHRVGFQRLLQLHHLPVRSTIFPGRPPQPRLPDGAPPPPPTLTRVPGRTPQHGPSKRRRALAAAAAASCYRRIASRADARSWPALPRRSAWRAGR